MAKECCFCVNKQEKKVLEAVLFGCLRRGLHVEGTLMLTNLLS